MSYKKYISIIVLLGFMVLPGCFPKRVVWSPDGETAAVFTKTDFYFTDKDGKLSDKVYDNVYGVDWLSDNERLILQTVHEYSSWSEVEQSTGERLRNEVIAAARAFENITGMEQWKAKYDQLKGVAGKNLLNGVALYYLAMQSANAEAELIEELKQKGSFDVHDVELCSWKDGKFTVLKTIGNYVDIVMDISVSPTDKLAMLTVCDLEGDEDAAFDNDQLWLVEIETGNSVLATRGVALYPAWSNDGSSIVYAAKEAASGDDGIFVGKLISAQVTDGNGLLVDKVESTYTVAGMVMSIWTKVRVLPDGKVLFPSLDMRLPIVPDDVPEQMDMYVYDPGINAGISRVGIKDKLQKISGYDLNFFEVSTDGRYASLVDHDGRVAVLDLKNGEVTVIVNEAVHQLGCVPVWRNATELTYLSKVKENGKSRNVVMCWDVESGERELSKGWPEEVVSGFRD